MIVDFRMTKDEGEPKAGLQKDQQSAISNLQFAVGPGSSLARERRSR
jgi:hypothetical protein